jgi:hypothetical protein
LSSPSAIRPGMAVNVNGSVISQCPSWLQPGALGFSYSPQQCGQRQCTPSTRTIFAASMYSLQRGQVSPNDFSSIRTTFRVFIRTV